MQTGTYRAVRASYPSENLTIGAGAAIFHVATARVVVCYHTRDEYWFLPKGRRNAGEETCHAAERESFEESGYRNRVIPLPINHRQPLDPNELRGSQRFVVEPLWTQMLPLSVISQYLLFWYVAETLPPEIEQSIADEGRESGARSGKYCAPPPFPPQTLEQRIALDVQVQEDGSKTFYEPVRHENTGVDEEEALYSSFILPIAEARQRLRGSVMEDVVRRGWELIELRKSLETIGRV